MEKKRSGSVTVVQITICLVTSAFFDFLDDVPSTFHVKQIKGRVSITKWGVVRLSTEKGEGKKGVLELHEVLFLPGMRVNIFSLQRIRD